MDAAFVSQVLSLIPERIARSHGGLPFLPEAEASRHPERVRLVAGFLNWLTPLCSLSKEDQQALGLPKDAEARGQEDEAGERQEDEGESAMPIEEDGADALEYMQAETAVGAGAPLAVPAA